MRKLSGEKAPDGIGGGTFETDYVSCRAIPQDMSVELNDGENLKIKPHGKPGMGIPEWLTIRTDRLQSYRDSWGSDPSAPCHGIRLLA